MVCDKKLAEAHFWEKGQDLNIITAVYSDVMSGPLTGDVTVFRRRGGPVSLYAPVDSDRLLLWPERERRHPLVGRWAPDRRDSRSNG